MRTASFRPGSRRNNDSSVFKRTDQREIDRLNVLENAAPCAKFDAARSNFLVKIYRLDFLSRSRGPSLLLISNK
ncbi:hypothetical protein MESS4_p20099 [Mesorhizobium sp. STM 4661]|nr:hypothetical protein MESS4_p20099 [Mesorhizobium sp. STM 4661]